MEMPFGFAEGFLMRSSRLALLAALVATLGVPDSTNAQTRRGRGASPADPGVAVVRDVPNDAAGVVSSVGQAGVRLARDPSVRFRLRDGVAESSRIRLQNGREMTGKEVIDFVNALEAAANDMGQSIREDAELPRLSVIPIPVVTQQMLQQQQSALSARVAQQLQLEKAGWKSAIGLPKFDTPPVPPPKPSVPAGTIGALPKDPLHFEWKSGVLGDKEWVALYATFVADLKAQATHKKGGEIKAVAELNGGVWILNHDLPLLNAMAMAKARTDGLEEGSFEWKVYVSLAGQSIYTNDREFVHKGPGFKSALPDLKFAKTWPLPLIEQKKLIPIVGPVSVELKVGAKGNFGFVASVNPALNLDYAKVNMTLAPHAEFSVYASAAASLAGLAQAGVEGNLNLLTLDLPTTAGLELKLLDKSPSQLTETLTGELKGSALKGSLVAFAEVDSGILSVVDALFCDSGSKKKKKCKIKLERLERPLVKWDGFKLSQKLLDIKAQQSPFTYGE
jgi:hypothetical protein